MQEIWEDVVGYEDMYQISNLGRLYSNLSNKILTQFISKTGYYTQGVRIGGRAGQAKCFRIHRLVAQAFIKNPQNKPNVKYIRKHLVVGCRLNGSRALAKKFGVSKDVIQDAYHMVGAYKE